MVTKEKVLLNLAIMLFCISIGYGLSIETDSSEFRGGEQVYFKVCPGNDVEVKVECLDSRYLHSIEWEDECRMYGFDSDYLLCKETNIIAKKGILEDYKILKIVDYEDALLKSIENSELEDALSIAKTIYAISLIDNYPNKTNVIYELTEELKVTRDEREKCWPANECSIRKTVEVAYYLSLAGIKRTNRVYHDALLWIEAKQNREEYPDWKIEIETDKGARCRIEMDNSLVERVSFDKNWSRIINLEYTAGEMLNVSCDEKFYIYLMDFWGGPIKSERVKSDKSFTFNMSSGCWPRDNSIEFCAKGVTERALLISGLNNNVLRAGRRWLEEDVYQARIAGDRLKTTEDIILNMYAYKSLQKQDIKTWILFSQNNDGSFGDAKDPITTVEALRILKGQNNEWIDDAVRWFTLNRPAEGWGDLILDAMTYETFMTTHPILKSNPLLIYMEEDEIEFELKGSDVYKVSQRTTGNIKDASVLRVEHQDKTSKGRLISAAEEDGLYTGHIEFSDQHYTKKIPVAIRRMPEISLELEQEYFLKGNQGELIVNVKKSRTDLECDFNFNKYFNNITVNLRDSPYVIFSYDIDKEGIAKIQGMYECRTNPSTIKGNFSFSIMMHPVVPFSYSANSYELGEDYVTLRIRNNIDRAINVSLNWEKDTVIYNVPRRIEIPADRIAEVYIYQSVRIGEERQETNRLVMKMHGYSEFADFMIILDERVHNVDEPYRIIREINYAGIIAILIIAIFALAILFLGLTNKRLVKALFNKYILRKTEPENPESKENKEEAIRKKKILKSKKNMKKNLAEVLMAVDKSLGETEEEITDELKKEGYKKNEIKKALLELNERLSRATKDKKKESNEEKST